LTAVPAAVLIEYEEGLMMRFQDFGDHARALAAAGPEA
jgi:hypothetical protein